MKTRRTRKVGMISRSVLNEHSQSTLELMERFLRRSRKRSEPDLPLPSSRVGSDGVLEHGEMGRESLKDLRGNLGRHVEEPLTENLDGGVVEIDRVGDDLELLNDVEDSFEMLERRLEVNGRKRNS